MVRVLICGKTPSAGRKDIFEDLTLAVFSWKHMVWCLGRKKAAAGRRKRFSSTPEDGTIIIPSRGRGKRLQRPARAVPGPTCGFDRAEHCFPTRLIVRGTFTPIHAAVR